MQSDLVMPDRDSSIRLSDGRSLDVSVWRYPLPWADQAPVIDLWRTEWEETGFDWLPWMNGAHASTMVTDTAVAWSGTLAIATATACYPVREPETCVVMNVITREGHRGLGIGRELTNLVVKSAFCAGCASAYLGNTPTTRSMYETCGFVRLSGVFMRRVRGDTPDPDVTLFAAGQRTAVREANWGDIPGFAALVAQPLETLLLDYPRGLISTKYLAPERGLTQFSSVWYGSRRAGGDMYVLTGDRAQRILGFGSFTPGLGPAKNFLADVDILCHGTYIDRAPLLLQSLLDAAVAKGYVRRLRLFSAPVDGWKQRCASDCGFSEPVKSTEELQLDKKKLGLMVQELNLPS